MSKNKINDSLEEKVFDWWSNLQTERKCRGTCNIAKVVNKSSTDEQNEVRKLISKLIVDSIKKCHTSIEISKVIVTCNAVNGCFDNFPQAADAANLSFNEIIKFIDKYVTECAEKLSIIQDSKGPGSQILELLHCLSRILVLTLKLRRPENFLNKGFSMERMNVGTKEELSELSCKISIFLQIDEVLMDTKCNFVMASLLIRELVVEDNNKLMQFHNQFLDSFPCDLVEEDFKLNILRFLLSSAILNAWSHIVIDSHSISAYLRYYIQLCERYSSDTAIILNISRALLLLLKNNYFSEFVNNVESDKFQCVNSLLSCVWMILDHPVACVRHSAKEFLQLLVIYPDFKKSLLNYIFPLSSNLFDKRSYFATLAALADECGTEELHHEVPLLPKCLINSVRDPTLVTHAIFALERLIVNDKRINHDFPKWCETWIVPLLQNLTKVPLVVGADLEKLLDLLFRRHPEAVFYIIDKWSDPRTDELRYIITALKICRHRGLKSEKKAALVKKDSVNTDPSKWKDLICEKLLRFSLTHNDDDIRVSAFSLIVQGSKTTEVYTEQDFALIRHFLEYNMNNQQPATRQKTLSFIKKMLTRFSDSLVVLNRTNGSSGSDVTNYELFKTWLIDFCFSNIFEGANFNRLNTALTTLLCCIEEVKDVEVDRSRVHDYWKRILVAMRSSYEENKGMAVIIAKKLKMNETELNNAKSLFDRANKLCSKMEPPNVLTGSYLLQVLIEFPVIRKILEDDPDCVDSENVRLLCMRKLAKQLEEQILVARRNLIKAAATGPMYGLLFAIRLMMRGTEFPEVNGDSSSSKAVLDVWREFINKLISLSFEMIHIVSCVVNSSSPEGHLPSDFQSDFHFVCPETFSSSAEEGDHSIEDESKDCDSITERIQLVSLSDDPKNVMNFCAKLMDRFNRLSISNYFAEVTSKDFEDLLKGCQAVMDVRLNSDASLDRYFNCVELVIEKIKAFNSSGDCEGVRPTAQMLLLCAWRSIKEACLFLGDLVSKIPLEDIVDRGLIAEEMLITIGEELRTLLCEIKHRGAFEQAYVGFTQLTNALWKCRRKNLHELPNKWLQEILNQIRNPAEKQGLKLCSTRRSAGLPFLVQAIITSELQHMKSAKIKTLEMTLDVLLSVVEEDSSGVESRIHSLNILRALFKHAMLGEHVAPYVSRALMVAVRGSRALTWSIRNSSSLLFSALVIRIFGVARNKDTFSRKNRMTSRTFFQRYPELFDFFLSEMKLGYRYDNHDLECHPQPNVFLILLILGRLYPPSTETPGDLDFSQFLPHVNFTSRNSTLKIRELSARALVPLIPPEELTSALNSRFTALESSGRVRNFNEMHGFLLQVKALLLEGSYNEPKLLQEMVDENQSKWIENSKWVLNPVEGRLPYFVMLTYLQILHILCKISKSAVERVAGVLSGNLMKDACRERDRTKPGYFVFLEYLHYLKLDVISSNEQLRPFFLDMLKSEIDEIQAIPLRILQFVTSSEEEKSLEGDDFNAITMRVSDLSQLDNISKCLESSRELKNYLSDQLREILPSDNVTMNRLRISVLGNFLLRNLPESVPETSIDSLIELLDSKDVEISTGAFIICSVSVFKKIAHGKLEKSDSISHFLRIMQSFADSDADVKQRIAVTEVLNKFYEFIDHEFFRKDSLAFGIWMLPFRLILDDEPFVRKNMMRLISNCSLKLRGRDLMIESDEFLATVPRRAQELLLDSYINLFKDDIMHLIIHMFLWSLSGFFVSVNYENSPGENEVGVFEKGHPNPYCEEAALSNLMCRKLKQLQNSTNFSFYLTKDLDSSQVECLRHFLPIVAVPGTMNSIQGAFEAVSGMFNDCQEPDTRALSLLSRQISDLKQVLKWQN